MPQRAATSAYTHKSTHISQLLRQLEEAHSTVTAPTLVIRLVIKLVQRALALGVTQQGLGTHHDERLAELTVHLWFFKCVCV